MRLLLAASLTLFAFSNVGNAQGSDCNYNASPCEAFANADAVFIGQVTKIAPETISIWQRDADYDQTANVVIEKMYKGTPRKNIVLHQLGRNSAPKLVLNSRYLFYANVDRITKKWEVRRCGRTRMASYVQDDLHFLARLPTLGNQSRIAGEVVRYEADEETPAGNTSRVAGVRLRVVGNGKKYDLVTDTNGVYEIYGLPAGRYTIEPEIPRGLTLMGVMHYGVFDRSRLRSLNIDVKDGECSGATILLMTDRSVQKS